MECLEINGEFYPLDSYNVVECVVCDYCDEIVPEEDGYYLENGDWLCESCFMDLACITACGHSLYIEDAVYNEDAGEWHCGGCADARSGVNTLLYTYHHKPEFNILYDSGLGVEIEGLLNDADVDDLEEVFKYNNVNYLNSCPDGVPLFHAEEDGSVDFECPSVILPGLKVADAGAALVGDLADIGCRAWEGGSCGLHINISLDYFDDLNHLKRFCYFSFVNKSFLLHVSGRGLYFNRYYKDLSVGEVGPVVSPDSVYKAFFNRYHEGGDRYCFISFEKFYKCDAIEFRLMRGTFNESAFKNSIYFLESLMDFTGLYKSVSLSDFFKFLEGWGGDLGAGVLSFIDKRTGRVGFNYR